MSNFEEWVENEKKKYLSMVIEMARKFDNIVIYGAGRKGIGLCKFLEKEGMKITAFCVTNITENRLEECGKKVYGINDLKFDKEKTLILIGTRKRWNDEVEKEIKKIGYKNFVGSPEGIEYFNMKDFDRSNRNLVQITTQIGCKIDCKYCPQQSFVKKYFENGAEERSMSFDSFKKYVDKINKDVIIEFEGFSEPFFNRDCIKMIQYAYSAGHDVSLFTTLMGLSIEEFQIIKKIPFREVVIHIPDQEKNSKIIITQEYLEVLQSILKTKKIDGLPFVDFASCHGEIAEQIREMCVGKVRIISKLHDRAGNLNESNVENVHRIHGKIKCSGAEKLNHNVLLPNGDILLCDSDWGMKHVLGNLNYNNYQEILESKELMRIKQMLEMNDSDVLCRNCCYAIMK